MKKLVLNGALILTISGFVCKALGAFYRIPLSNLLGVEGIGVYQMIFAFYSLAVVVCGGVIPTSMALTISKMRALQSGNIKIVFWKYFFISVSFGVLFLLLFIFFAPIISSLQGNQLATLGYRYVGFAVLFSSLIAPIRGLFQGYENMTPTAISQIIEQFFKLLFGLLFIYLFKNSGVQIIVAGAILGVVISEFLSFLYLYIKLKLFNKKIIIYNNKNINFANNFGKIFVYVLIIPFVTLIDSFLVVNLLNINFSPSISTQLFGLQSGMVNSLINFPVIFSLALSTSLLPSLSYYNAKKNQDKAKEKISDCLNFIWLFILPCILAFYVLAPLILGFAYRNLNGSMFNISVNLLKLSSFQMLFVALLQITASVLQAKGKTSLLIFNLLVCSVIKISLTAIFVSTEFFNIFGLALSNLVFYFLSCMWNLIYLVKEYKLKINLKKIILPLFLILLTYFICEIVDNLNVNLMIKLSLFSFFGLIIYIIPIFYFKLIIFNKKKVKND